MITDEQLQHKIIIGSHAGLGSTPQARCTGGHFGMTRTREIITREYYWRGVTKDVEYYIQRCDRCQCRKSISIQKTRAKLRSVPVPKKVWYQISIDLMQMSECRGYKYILGVQDYFSKWTEMVPIPNKKASTIAKELYFMFTRYGCPRRIISDRGREFCNELSKKLFGYFGVEHRLTAPYHPQANGMLIFIFAFSNLKFCSGCLRILKLESAKILQTFVSNILQA